MEVGGDGEGVGIAHGPRLSVARSVGLTTVATGLAYATTLLQQALYGRGLGVNAETDVLATALTWGVATTGLVGTAVSSVFLPAFVRAMQQDDMQRGSVLRGGWTLALSIAVALTLATFVGAGMLSELLGPGLVPAERRHLVDLLRLTSPLQLIWIAAWMGISIANASERFVLAAASAIVPPLPVLAVFAFSTPRVDDVAAAYVAGASLQLIVLGFAGRRSLAGWIATPDFVVVRGLLLRLVQTGFAFTLIGAIPILVRAVASRGGPGDVAVADYASRMALAGEQLVLAGFLAVVFTQWSATDPALPVAQTITRVLGVVVAVAFALPIVAHDLISIVLEGGRFTATDVDRVASFLRWMAPGVAAHMLLMVVTRALLAQSKFVAFGAASAIALIVFAVVAIAGHSEWGLEAVAIAYSIAWLAAVTVATAGLRVAAPPVLAELASSAGMGAASGLAMWVVLQLLPGTPALRVLVAGGSFIIVGLVVGRALGVSAVRYVVGRLPPSSSR